MPLAIYDVPDKFLTCIANLAISDMCDYLNVEGLESNEIFSLGLVSKQEKVD